MRFVLPLAVLILARPVSAAEPPLVEKYLHSGQLVLGEQVLERELKKNPKDDQIRFGLGVIRLTLGIERLAQTLHEYGLKTGSGSGIDLLGGLPVPPNPEPNAITYKKFRSLLDDGRRGLLAVDATLAGITDDNVKLPLRLAKIKLDLDGDGKATDDFTAVLGKFLGRRADFLAKNGDFLVHFDRGDVAWLRSYCHVAAAVMDAVLSVDFQTEFEHNESGGFPKVLPKFTGTPEERAAILSESRKRLRIAEPARLGRVREHFLEVAKLNREAWRHIRAETDDDHEWLPNAKQTSVIGLPVRDAMIDGWLETMDEFEKLLEGKHLLPIGLLFRNEQRGFNVKTFLEQPPAAIEFQKLGAGGIDEKYLEKGTLSDFGKLIRVAQLFDPGSAGMYMAYFN
jgi:hypothetical protein